jgi:hypothetical protein
MGLCGNQLAAEYADVVVRLDAELHRPAFDAQNGNGGLSVNEDFLADLPGQYKHGTLL